MGDVRIELKSPNKGPLTRETERQRERERETETVERSEVRARADQNNRRVIMAPLAASPVLI